MSRVRAAQKIIAAHKEYSGRRPNADEAAKLDGLVLS